MNPKRCKDGTDSCGVTLAPAYFISFVVLCTFVVLNLFILVILQQFETYYLPENNLLNQFKENLEEFNVIWSKYSKKFKGDKISGKDLLKFLRDMEPPLGFKGKSVDIIKVIADLMVDE